MQIPRRRSLAAFAAAAAIALLSVSLPPPARADEPVAQQAAAATPLTAQSKISATIEFSLAALDRALERRVPRRLATFDDRATRCWHRRMLRREVDIDCVYSGFVERTGPISLRAERGRLTAAVPVYGAVSGEGVGRFARLLHGAAEGQLMVYATARPRLRPDWTVALDMSEGFRWQAPPVLRILGFEVNLSRFVEPKIREQLQRVEAEASANLRNLDLRAKAETAWRTCFAAVKIADTPAIWVQMTPQTVAFAGLRAHGDVLEGSLEMTGLTATSIGSEPAANTPTSLPALGSDVSEPGRFAVVLPVDIDYDAIRAKLQEAITAMNETGLNLRDIKLQPSAGKLVFGLRFAGTQTGTQTEAKDGDWIYLTATPRLDAGTQTIQFPDLSISQTPQPAPSALAGSFNDTRLQTLRQQLRLGYQAALDKIIAAANTRLSRSLGNGFRSEAHLTSAGLSNIELLQQGARLNFRAAGDLKILYGL